VRVRTIGRRLAESMSLDAYLLIWRDHRNWCVRSIASAAAAAA
jgi:hypothetical protein